MKSFNEYKNGIDTVTENMKNELFDLINQVDFTDFHSIKRTLESNSRFEKFESVYPPVIDGYFVFENQNVTIKYNDLDKTIKAMDLDDFYNYIEIEANVCLLKYISTSSGALNMTSEPLIESNLLNTEIEQFIKEKVKYFSSVLVYNSNITMDNVINSKFFFVVDHKNIIIQGSIKIDEFENIFIENMDVYNVGKRELRLISKYTTDDLNVTAIKYIFENIRLVEMGEGLSSILQTEGFDYFDTEEFQDLLDMKTLF